MVETKDLEVGTAEADQIMPGHMEVFLESGMRYFVILKGGRYAGVIDGRAVKNKGACMTAAVRKERGFSDARAFFQKYENRGKLVALLDDAGGLLTFLVWNQRAEAEREWLERSKAKVLELLKGGYAVEFHNWDEYTDTCIRFCEKSGDWTKQIFLTGRNWEPANKKSIVN